MVRLKQPIRVQQVNTGSTDILTLGSAPLPIDDNNIRTILFGYDISVTAACTVKITSGDTTVLEKVFAAAGTVSEADMERKGEKTNDLVLEVTGTATVTCVAECGFEYTGGSLMLNNPQSQYANSPS